MLNYLHLLLLMLTVNLKFTDSSLIVNLAQAGFLHMEKFVPIPIKVVNYYLARFQNIFFVSVRGRLFLEGFLDRPWTQMISGRVII